MSSADGTVSELIDGYDELLKERLSLEDSHARRVEEVRRWISQGIITPDKGQELLGIKRWHCGFCTHRVASADGLCPNCGARYAD